MDTTPEKDTFDDIWGGYQKYVFFYGLFSTIILGCLSMLIYPISLYVLGHSAFVARHSDVIINLSPYSHSIEANLAKTPLDAESRRAILLSTSVMLTANAINAVIHIGGMLCFYNTNRRVDLTAALGPFPLVLLFTFIGAILPLLPFNPPGPGKDIKTSDPPILITSKLSLSITFFFMLIRITVALLYRRL